MKLPDALNKLSGLIQWVAWDDEDGSKVPKSPYGGNAKANDMTTWGSLDEALTFAEKHGYKGVGIELDGGLVGIDLDHCVKDGVIEPWAQKIIDEIGSYAEISPSGEGVHILAIADTKKVGSLGRANHEKGIEVYNHGRYFTVTGNVIKDEQPRLATYEIASLVATEFAEESKDDYVASTVGGMVGDQVMRLTNDTVERNVRRDRKKHVRYARIPTTKNPCEYCTELASRGFVYWSKESAKAFSGRHGHCRCEVVAGVPEMEYYSAHNTVVSRGHDKKVQFIEGYDPDKYFEMYQENLRLRAEREKKKREKEKSG